MKSKQAAPRSCLFGTVITTIFLIIPFGIILYQGSLLSIFFAISFCVSILAITKYSSYSSFSYIQKTILLFYMTFPFLYASFLLGNIKGLGLAMLIFSFLPISYIFYQSFSFKRQILRQQIWPTIEVQMPSTAPQDIENIMYQHPKESTIFRLCILYFPSLQYKVNSTLITSENFKYYWMAPLDTPEKEFNYAKELKDRYVSLKYNPDAPTELATILPNEVLNSFIKDTLHKNHKSIIPFLPFALIGLLLVIFG